MQKKAQKVILVGCHECDYRMCTKETNTLVKSRDVIFNAEHLLRSQEIQIPLSNETQEKYCQEPNEHDEDNERVDDEHEEKL